jgi:hypothetical protein
MDTKNCPYCGEEILAAAKKCKHCGEWLDKEVNMPKETLVKKQEIKNSEIKNISHPISCASIESLIIDFDRQYSSNKSKNVLLSESITGDEISYYQNKFGIVLDNDEKPLLMLKVSKLDRVLGIAAGIMFTNKGIRHSLLENSIFASWFPSKASPGFMIWEQINSFSFYESWYKNIHRYVGHNFMVNGSVLGLISLNDDDYLNLLSKYLIEKGFLNKKPVE